MSIEFPRKVYTLDNGCMTCAKMLPRGRREVAPRELQNRKWQISFEGEPWAASRLSYHLNKSRLPRSPDTTDGFVLHTCDHGWCIHPDHLYLGTIQQNTVDKFARHQTIRELMSEGSKRAWKSRSKETRDRCLSNLYGQAGQPSYERTEANRKCSAESRRANWSRLTPEQRAERCLNISRGKQRAKNKSKTPLDYP